MRVRTIIGVTLLVLAGVTTYSGPVRLPLYGPRANVRATPLPAPERRTAGRLTWLGGVRLTSDDSAFGGFSALAVRRQADGNRFLLLSDGGNAMWATFGADWMPRRARFGELPDGPRTGWEKRDRDSESLALASDGRMWVGFESANEIWRYAPGLRFAERQVRPPAMRRWDRNGGAEAMVRLTDGRFVVISETSRWPGQGGRAGIVFRGDPAAGPKDGFRFVYRPAPGFDPSDITQLPDGDLLVLERQWLLPVRFRSRLALVPRAALKPGAVVTGQEVGRVAPPWLTENFEGLAVTVEHGATILWLVSDDDQTWWRRTYLIKLRLDPPRTAAARRSVGATGRR